MREWTDIRSYIMYSLRRATTGSPKCQIKDFVPLSSDHFAPINEDNT